MLDKPENTPPTALNITSNVWECRDCGFVHEYKEPVPMPQNCLRCGGGLLDLSGEIFPSG
jgi:rubrerythrin